VSSTSAANPDTNNYPFLLNSSIQDVTGIITVAIVTRRLKEGKTYEDFRKSWFHTIGFGAPSNLYTMINVNDPREITVIGFVQSELEQVKEGLKIDVKERLDHSLDDIIEPEIGRSFGILVSDDDFSSPGPITYRPASIDGTETDLDQVSHNLSVLANMIAEASAVRDRIRKENPIKKI
jgi:hypothetical protein